MPNEIWKSIKAFPGYEVSNLGRVRSYRQQTPKILSNCLDKPDGYPRVGLFRREKGRRTFFVHRLVLETFVGACPIGYQCNHKNTTKTDNRLSNLEWVPPGINMMHAYKLGLYSKEGTMHHNAQLKDEDIKEIRKLAAQGFSSPLIAGMFKVKRRQISRIISREQWSHI